MRNGGIQQVLTHRVTREFDLLFREEAFHALIGHTDAGSLLGKQLIGDASIRVLLLQ